MNDFTAVKRAAKLEEYVARYIDLERKGNNYVGICPFHQEKDGSFTINTDGQFYYCFGCHARGDIFDFEMEYNGKKHGEALRDLADEYGVEVSEHVVNEGVAALNADFHEFQDKAVSGLGLSMEYLLGRGISEASAKLWNLGGAVLTEGDTRLFGWSDDMIGLTVATFPVYTVSGKLAQMWVRPIEKHTRYKYVGSSKRLANYEFSLFGAQFCRRRQRPIVVEGHVDAVLFQQAGFVAIANMGSGLSQDHEDFYKKVQPVGAVFDGDSAGLNFSKHLSLSSVHFPITLSEWGKDPADILTPLEEEERSEQVASWVKSMLHPVVLYTTHGIDLEDFGDRLEVYERIHEHLGALPLAKLSEVAKYLAKIMGEDPDIVFDSLRRSKPSIDHGLEQGLLYAMISDLDAYTECLSLPDSIFGTNSCSHLFNIIKLFAHQGRSFSTSAIVDFVGEQLPSGFYPWPLKPMSKDWRNIKVELQLLSERRSIESACNNAVATLEMGSDPDTVRSELTSRVSVKAGVVVEDDNRSKSMVEVIRRVNFMMSSEDPILGAKLGDRWTALNESWSGIQLGKYHVISGDNGAGKSAIATNWAIDLSEGGEHVCVISSEMSSDDIRMRMVAIQSGLDETAIKTGDLDSLEYLLVEETAEDIASLPLWVVNSDPTIDAWLATIDHYYAKYGCRYFVVDYLQQASGQGTLYECVTDATTKLQARCYNKHRPIGLIAVSQQNREGGRQELGGKQDVSGSYKVMMDADRVLIPSEKKDKRIEKDGIQFGNRFFTNAKNRGGAAGHIWNGYLENLQCGIPGTLRSGIVPDTGMDWWY